MYLRLIAIGLAIVAFVGGCVAYHHHVYQSGYDAAEAIYQKLELEANLKAKQELADANAQIRSLSLKLTSQLDQIAELKQKEQQDAKAHETALRAALRTGAVRLSIPIAACESGQAGPDQRTGVASGAESQARAELLPAIADDLASLAFDADAEVRRTNECIDRYESVRRILNGE